MQKKSWTRRRFLRTAAISGAVLSQRGGLRGWPQELSAPSEGPVMFFEQPADEWRDALPVGNGRLGAMVFGHPAHERLQLNEETVWMGERRDRNNPQAGHAPEVRRLLMAGKVHEAEALAAQVMMGIPDRLPCYQTLGDLWLEIEDVPAEVSGYRLELDLDEAVVRTRFTAGKTRWTREVFSSGPRNVIAVLIEASEPMGMTVRLDRPAHSETAALGADRLVMTGAARPVKRTTDPATQERQVGVSFRAEVRAIAKGGVVRADGNKLRIENARTVTLLLTAATDFRERDAAGMAAACARRLREASGVPYKQLRAEHVTDYRRYARRAGIALIDGPDPLRDMPTDKRLARVKDGGEDPGLVETYFRFGRYMLISSSRPGTLAANLQGIWNEIGRSRRGAAKYTVNINAEMNYWLAESANLADLHLPLFDLLDATRGPGAVTARRSIQRARMVVHHNTDIWGDSGPIDGTGGGIWPMGAAWLSLHLWTHYEYSGDRDFCANGPIRTAARERDVSARLPRRRRTRSGKLVSGPFMLAGEQVPAAGRKGVQPVHGAHDGHRDHSRGLRSRSRSAERRILGGDADLRRARRGRHPAPACRFSDRARSAAAGVAGGLRRPRARAPAHLASLRAVS